MRKPSLHNKQNGQAILLIAVLMVSLIAALGLAIDGGGMFLMYRDVQNATDAAGLSAAFALCTGDNPEDAALRSAALNGFEHGVDFAEVTVENPPTTGSRAGDPLFVSVTITDQKPSYFIRVVYTGELKVSATTISRCDPGSDFGFPENSALVSLRPYCDNGSDPNYGIRNSGNSGLAIIGTVYVNQDDTGCSNDYSVNVSGSGFFTVSGEVCTRGRVRYNGTNFIRDNANQNEEADIRADEVDGDTTYSQCDVPLVTDPEPLGIGTPNESELCPDVYAALPTDSDPSDDTTWAQPGRYTTFTNSPGNGPNHDVTYLSPGIYCVTGDIDIDNVLVGEGVFIYQSCSAIPNNDNCTFDFNSQANLELSGMTSGDYQNMTFYSLGSNTGNPGNKFRGRAQMQMSGTFYAPYAHCDIAGGVNTTFLAQFVCYTSDFIGGGETTIQYNPNTVYRNPATFGIEE